MKPSHVVGNGSKAVGMSPSLGAGAGATATAPSVSKEVIA